jgi:6-phosphogluconate dehydrogenase
MQIGILGLGKMGSRIALKLLKEGHEVVVWNRSQTPVQELASKEQRAKSKETIEELIASLEKPRVVWLMLPAGDATEEVLTEVERFVEKDDIIIDGGNGKFSDTELRFKRLTDKGIRFLGIGVSGGIIAQEQGYPLMVGGDKSAYEYVTPIWIL